MLSLINSLRLPVSRISLINRRSPNVPTLLRFKSTNTSDKETLKLKNRSTLYYATAATVLFVGLTYAAVPLYRLFCQVRLKLSMMPEDSRLNDELFRLTVTVEQQP